MNGRVLLTREGCSASSYWQDGGVALKEGLQGSARLKGATMQLPRCPHQNSLSHMRVSWLLSTPRCALGHYRFASTTERTRVRDPIIINGAGPAGLVLAIGLQNANIPYEICERHRHDLPSRPRRNHVSLLRKSMFNNLTTLLKFPDRWLLLRTILANAPIPDLNAPFQDYPIH